MLTQSKKKISGVASYTVSLEDQSAEVITTAAASTAAQALQMELGFQTVLEKIRRSGKIVTAAVVDGVEVEV